MAIKAKASLSQSNGRPGWCVIFRHPLRMGNNGRPGLRVRRGLGTSDEGEANRLVSELNEILSDETLWSPSAKDLALTRYSPVAVAAFYDGVAPATRDLRSIRDSIIPLPTREDGYTKALLLGPTGAGKTTVLRQLIGTDPDEERFPSTSASRTTICNTEIVIAEGPFRAAVTFQPRDHIRLLVEECIMEAALAKLDAKPDDAVLSRLLEHKDMRFRLAYILGSARTVPTIDTAEEEDEDDDTRTAPAGSALPPEEQTINRERLFQILEKIGSITKTATISIQDAFADLSDEQRKKEWDAIQELFEESLQEQKEFHDLVDELVDIIEERFAFVASDGVISRGDDGWPISWNCVSNDRKGFLKFVNRFSSNYAPQFGRLLTPVVEGIRVAGKFVPEWQEAGNQMPFVLFDGEGLGHTTETATSISTNVTAIFKDVDVIVIVDNAAQPLQAATTAAIKTVAVSGHVGKLLLCFTHFEEVKGVNLPGIPERKKHVLNSLENAISSMGESLGRQAENTLRENTEGRAFFLSKIHKAIPETAKGTRKELFSLIEGIKSLGAPKRLAEATPIYDSANLVLGIHRAISEFHRPWNARLGFVADATFRREHWSAIKALTRRLGVLGEDEYGDLRPVADLIIRLQEEIGKFVLNPLRWEGANATDVEKSAILETIKQSVFSRLHEFSTQQLFAHRIMEWSHAYARRGKGSTAVRANDIRGIYEESVPRIGTVPDERGSTFLSELRCLVKEAIAEHRGTVSDS
jgi:hypothetical protein